MDLFAPSQAPLPPLPERMRPKKFNDVAGQPHLTGPDGILRKWINENRLPSLVFWGPPGTGKTTLARIICETLNWPLQRYSAVVDPIKDVRAAMEKARALKRAGSSPSLIFVDEIHRYNKAAQDVFLPYLEEGSVVLIGATTENPSFRLRAALLSRTRVLDIKPLSAEDLAHLLARALKEDAVLSKRGSAVPENMLLALGRAAQGDVRAALNLLDALMDHVPDTRDAEESDLKQLAHHKAALYDADGEEHYNQISALHKSMRNSDADAAVYWLTRMIDGGEDPLYVARRMIRFASEDIGNADPRALILANATYEVVDKIGLPECDVALTQLALYLSLAPKSNGAYVTLKNVERSLSDGHRYPVPKHIRNAPTDLMKAFDYGKGYAYAHHEASGVSKMSCLPNELKDIHFVEFGQDEDQLQERYKTLKQLRTPSTDPT